MEKRKEGEDGKKEKDKQKTEGTVKQEGENGGKLLKKGMGDSCKNTNNGNMEQKGNRDKWEQER